MRLTAVAISWRTTAAGLLLLALSACGHSGSGRASARPDPVTHHDPRAGRLPTPTAQPRIDPAARAVIDGPHDYPPLFGADAAGDLIGIYSHGRAHRPTAVAVRSRGVSRARLAPSVLTGIVPVPNGWVVSRQVGDSVTAELVGRDAVVGPLPQSSEPTRPRAGDVPLFFADGGRIEVHRASDGRAHPIGAGPEDIPHPYAGYVTPAGHLLVLGTARGASGLGAVDVMVGDRWHATAALDDTDRADSDLDGSGAHVAVLTQAFLSISDDGGRSWRVTPVPSAFDSILLAVTSSGTVFASTATACGRVLPGQRFEPVPGGCGQVFTVGDDVYAQRGDIGGPLRVSHDQGSTWERISSPGR